MIEKLISHQIFIRSVCISSIFISFSLLKKVKTSKDFLLFLKYESYLGWILTLFFIINDIGTGIVLYVMLLIFSILFLLTNILVSLLEGEFKRFILSIIFLYLLGSFSGTSEEFYIYPLIVILVIYDILTLSKVKEFLYNIIKEDLKGLFFNEYKINRLIKDVNIDNIKYIILKNNNGNKFIIKEKNLKKIVKYILDHIGKNIFKSGELNNIFKYIIKNYKSNLKEGDYKKNLDKLKEFVDNGGEVVVKYKKI